MFHSMCLRKIAIPWVIVLIAFASFSGCSTEDDNSEDSEDYGDDNTGDDSDSIECPEDEGESATSRDMIPYQEPSYYIEQSVKYFDTLDSYADPQSIPNYSELVARWEWPPWLKLTGMGADQMVLIDLMLKLYPTTVPIRDCRAFDRQPFGRCHVVFFYQDRPCPIYEEFTFNDQGEMTFIEAWSDFPGMLPTPDPNDYWAEGEEVQRLSTKIPGLGSETGLIDADGACMQKMAREDADVADFRERARYPIFWWLSEFFANPDSFEVGCGWATGKEQSIDCMPGRQDP